MEGDVIGAVAGFRGVSAECEAAHDEFVKPVSRMGLAVALAQCGEVDAARSVAHTALDRLPQVWMSTSRQWVTRRRRLRRWPQET